MKFPRRLLSLVFLLLTVTVLASALQPGTPSDSQEPRLLPRDPPVDRDSSSSQRPNKQDIGTKDAPVDGADGKPHKGPFVEYEQSRKKSSAFIDTEKPIRQDRSRKLAEDGVMNDRNRDSPKKGTTGTERGVSEKSREREEHESQTGRRKEQKPESPKDALVTSHGDTAEPKAEEGSKKDRASSRGSSKADGVKSEKEIDKPKGAAGIEKPNDLPSKPHDIPPPDPPTKHSNSHDPDDHNPKSEDAINPIFKSANKKESGDDTDYDTSDESSEGIHDLIRWDSLFGSFSSIAATEIGDKTFIVAALMAMRHPRLQVFTAAFAALFLMTILSGVTGHAVGAILSKKWSALVAAVLFMVFGIKSVREGLGMRSDDGIGEEMKEVQAELEEKEGKMMANGTINGNRKLSSISPAVLESGRAGGSRSRSRGRLGSSLKRDPSISSSERSPSPSRAYSAASKSTVDSALFGVRNLLGLLLSPAWVETFSMTFVGELGDRSQIATVAMAAGQEYYWVMVGATLGHFVCTAGAVLGGSVLAGRVSMRKVTLVGGAIFIAFGIFTLFEAVQYWR